MGHRYRYNPGADNNGRNYNRTYGQSSQFDNYPQQNRLQQQQQHTHNNYPNPVSRYYRSAQQPQQQQYLPQDNQFTTTNPASSTPKTRSERRLFRECNNRDRHSPSNLPPTHVTEVEGGRGDPPPTTPTTSFHLNKRPGPALSSSPPVSSDRKRAKLTSTNDPSSAFSVPPKFARATRGAERSMSRYWDRYCWVCHSLDPKSPKVCLGNAYSATMLNCSNCPRSFHEGCRLSTKYQPSAASEGAQQHLLSPFVCPECQIINQGGQRNSYLTQTKPEITPERFKRFFELAMRRARLLMSSKKTIGIPPFFPSDADLIVNPLDLNVIEQNIRRLKYTSTDSFMADIRWLYHNASILHSPSNLSSNSACSSSSSVASVNSGAILATLKKVENACWEEVSEMNTCSECYLNAHARDDWFAVVCSPVHTLVWAKVKGFSYWPGKALRIRPATAFHLASSSSNTDTKMVDVRFFGKHDKSWVPITNCFLLSENLPFNTSTPNWSTRRNKGYEQSMVELAIHLSNIQSLYDCPFPYALEDTLFSTLFTSGDHFTTSNNPLNHLHELLVAGVNKSISTKNNSHGMHKTAYVSLKRTHCAPDIEPPMCFTKSKDPPILPSSNSLRVKTQFCHKNSDASVTSAKSPPSSTGFQVERITSAIAENLAVTLEPQETPPSFPPSVPEVTAVTPLTNKPAESALRECSTIDSQALFRNETLSSILEQSAPLAPSRSAKAEYQPPPPSATSLTALECAPPNDIVMLPRSNRKLREEQTDEQLPICESDNSNNMCDSPSVVFVAQIKNTNNDGYLNEGIFASRAAQILKSLQQANKDFPLSTIGALTRAIANNSGLSSTSSDHSNHQEDHKLATTIQVINAPKEVKNQPLSVPVKNHLKRKSSALSNQPPLKSSFSNTSNLIPSVPVSVTLTSEPKDVKPHITLFNALSSTQYSSKPSAESNLPPSKSSPLNTNNLNLSVPVSFTSEAQDVKPHITFNAISSTHYPSKPSAESNLPPSKSSPLNTNNLNLSVPVSVTLTSEPEDVKPHITLFNALSSTQYSSKPSAESNLPPSKSSPLNTNNLNLSVPVSVTSEAQDVKPHITFNAISSTHYPSKPSAESNLPPSKSSPLNTNNLNLSVPVSVTLTSEPEDVKPHITFNALSSTKYPSKPSAESNLPPSKSSPFNTNNLNLSAPVSFTSEAQDVKPHITFNALSSTQYPSKPSAESNLPPSKSSFFNTNNLNLSVPVSVTLTSEPQDVKPRNLILCSTSTSTQSAPKPVFNECNQSFPPVTAPKLEPGLAACPETSAAPTCFTTSSLPISYVPLVNIQPPTSCAHESIPQFNTNTCVSTTLSPFPPGIAVKSVAPTAAVTIYTLTSTIVAIKQEPIVLTTIVESNTCNSVDRHSTPSPNITRGKELSLTNTEARSIKLGLNRALPILSSSSYPTSNSTSAINVSQLSTLASELTNLFLPSTPSSRVGACQNLLPSLTHLISMSTEQGIPDSTLQSPPIDDSPLMTSQITGPLLNRILGPTPAITCAIDACGNTPPPTTTTLVDAAFTITSPRSPQNNQLLNSILSDLTNLVTTPLLNPMACDLSSVGNGPAVLPLLHSYSIESEIGPTTPSAATSSQITLPIYPRQLNEGEFDPSPFISQVAEIMKEMTRQLQTHVTTAVSHLKTLPVSEPPHVVELASGDKRDVINLKEHHHHLMVLWQNAKAFYAKKLESMQKSYQMSYDQIEKSNLLCTEKLAQRETRMKELENHFNNEIQSHKNELSQCYGMINKLQNDMIVEREQTQKAIEEIKRKQWCVACLKEAVYYCCVGIWYCDEPCQIAHWEVHKDVCEEMKRKNAETNSPKRSSENLNGHIQARQPNYLAAIPSLHQPMNNGMFVNQLPGSSYTMANHCSNDPSASMYYPFVLQHGLPNMSYPMRRHLPRPPPTCESLEHFH